MLTEIQRGQAICEESDPSTGGTLDFARLTEPFNFFGPNSYGNYLQA
jgi:hypothetical protein